MVRIESSGQPYFDPNRSLGKLSRDGGRIVLPPNIVSDLKNIKNAILAGKDTSQFDYQLNKDLDYYEDKLSSEQRGLINDACNGLADLQNAKGDLDRLDKDLEQAIAKKDSRLIAELEKLRRDRFQPAMDKAIDAINKIFAQL